MLLGKIRLQESIRLLTSSERGKKNLQSARNAMLFHRSDVDVFQSATDSQEMFICQTLRPEAVMTRHFAN